MLQAMKGVTISMCLLIGITIMPVIGGSTEIEGCLSFCSKLDQDFKALMKKTGIPEYPHSCKYGSGRGSGGVRRSFLVMDSPEEVYRWYQKRLKGWYRYRDPHEPDDIGILYKGPEINVNDPDILEFGWDYSEQTRIKAVPKKQHFGMCEWATSITININEN